MKLFKRLFREEDGQGLVEYILIVGLIALVVVATIKLAGESLDDVWEAIKDEIDKIPVGSGG